MIVSIIAAIDEKRGLGRDNDLLFKIPEDMKRLRVLTSGHPLVMGRRTFESLGRLLPNRIHIVITRDPKSLEKLSYQPDKIVSSLEEGLQESIKYYVSSSKYNGAENTHNTKNLIQNTEHEVFIFGGGQIFREAIEKGLVDRLYLTIVEGDYEADVFFPKYPEFTKVIEDQSHQSGGFRYRFLTLEK